MSAAPGIERVLDHPIGRAVGIYIELQMIHRDSPGAARRAFVAILAMLAGQGLTMGPLMRRLRIGNETESGA